MSQPMLHQVLVGARPADAITDQAFLIRRWLREAGVVSDIFAQHIHPTLAKEVRLAFTYRPARNERLVIYHVGIGSDVTEQLMALPLQLILVYHNITPPEFFAQVAPVWAQKTKAGYRQLLALKAHTTLALAASSYNELELRQLGFKCTTVLPISLDESQYDKVSNPELVAQFQDRGPLLLFVGRLVPNKKQEDLIKLLYYYRRIEPTARLVLVGRTILPEYERWLQDLVRDLGLQEAVLFTGQVSQQDLVTYYRLADLYVSMSEHEGVGKPLIESMYLDLPVLAYAATGVPYTLKDAGVLVHRKEYEALAELVDLLVTDEQLRTKLIAGQRRRTQDFLEQRVRQQLFDRLGSLNQLMLS